MWPRLTSNQSLDIENMDFVGEMFNANTLWSRTETFDLTAPTARVCLCMVAVRERFPGKKVEDLQQLFPLMFRGCGEELQDRVVDRILIGKLHRPSEERRSCSAMT